ncbi:hypothetical protein DT019_03160 [Streptomyces sp. SDr-06]|uniref:hypothetical protein n=1 Tax=Streptomyces sp. SDr-06 TaxID=2267702 RepID=UPI000DE8A580|nr:hypothetical protein [Streptomyces sp. SDr-06]RCH70503.1 hypothetical protein DT019_03160 [Streptomyces sp. SDr-06]
MKHTADTINDDELDALYERLARAEGAVERVRALLASRTWHRAEREHQVARLRAAVAEPQSVSES